MSLEPRFNPSELKKLSKEFELLLQRWFSGVATDNQAKEESENLLDHLLELTNCEAEADPGEYLDKAAKKEIETQAIDMMDIFCSLYCAAQITQVYPLGGDTADLARKRNYERALNANAVDTFKPELLF